MRFLCVFFSFFFFSIIGPFSYDDAATSCVNDQGGILAPLTDTAEIHAALCTVAPTEFRIQGIARDECWVDHKDNEVNPDLLDVDPLARPYDTLYVDTVNNIIKEQDQNMGMAVFCQFPKDPGT